MVRIRKTHEPSGHAYIGSGILCAKAPPCANFFHRAATAHPVVATTGIGLAYPVLVAGNQRLWIDDVGEAVAVAVAQELEVEAVRLADIDAGA